MDISNNNYNVGIIKNQNKKYWIIIGFLAAIALISLSVMICGIVFLAKNVMLTNNHPKLIPALMVGISAFFLVVSIINMGLIFINRISLKEELIDSFKSSIKKMKSKTTNNSTKGLYDTKSFKNTEAVNNTKQLTEQK